MRLSETFGLLGAHKQLQSLEIFETVRKGLMARAQYFHQLASSIPREQPSSKLVTAIPAHITIRSTNIRLDQ
jgi:hypothetical protein